MAIRLDFGILVEGAFDQVAHRGAEEPAGRIERIGVHVLVKPLSGRLGGGIAVERLFDFELELFEHSRDAVGALRRSLQLRKPTSPESEQGAFTTTEPAKASGCPKLIKMKKVPEKTD